MRLDLKHVLLLFVVCGLIFAWFVDRKNLHRQLTAKNQSLAIKRMRADRPPVLGFPGYVISHEPTGLETAASFLYLDVLDATSVHDIVRVYKRHTESLPFDQFELLARRILQENSWSDFQEFERKMAEYCVEAPPDREDFARFLGLETEKHTDKSNGQ